MNNLLWQSLANQADRISEEALAGISTLAEWEAELPARRLELRRSLGLEPWPASGHGVPAIRECGEFQGSGYSARKISYELLPDCWGSAVIYYPNPLPPEKCPAVLYNCGHTPTGSWAYQAHPILWARRGYVCLILDSMEQNDNPGEHHGFLINAHSERLALGYVSSGGEAFSAIRALDVLEAEPSVDKERLGVTGVSGGGAISYFTAALDERIRAVSTLCGICSLRDALRNRHLIHHCDCMFPLNLYQRDAPDIAALIAPRAALFCFGKQDTLYHFEECVSLTARAEKIWDLYEASERCKTVVAEAPHGDHPEFDQATQRWFDLHLAGEERPLLTRGDRDNSEATTSVHHGATPSPNRLALIPEMLRSRGSVPLPQTDSEWMVTRKEVCEKLEDVLPGQITTSLTPDTRWQWNGNSLSSHRGKIGDFDVSVDVHEHETISPTTILSTATVNQGIPNIKAAISPALQQGNTTLALFEPRLSGLNFSGEGETPFPAGTHWPAGALQSKAMSLVGASPVGYFFQDIQAAVSYLRSLPGQADAKLFLHGTGLSAVGALLVALVDETIAGVILEDLPISFADRSALIGILGVLDIPQAIGLLAPRTATLINFGAGNMTWATRAYARLNAQDQFIQAPDIRVAISILMK